MGPDSLNGEVFNVGTSVEKSAREIGGLLLQALNKPQSLLQTVPDRLGHVRRHAVNSDKLRQTLGWEAQISWESGLQSTLEWYQAHPEWWQAAIQAQAERIPGYDKVYPFRNW